ncbi:putative lipoprotein [Candidatus Fokinia solitaria]|uniref:Putative lipoprotein n=1 Tax=Candidatus Fokinia solitaria TaxID=1802984 RepID=A0A2U8BRH7_9RICK|nr:putative lipoprotein [Candidatus Fokinia solitaria]
MKSIELKVLVLVYCIICLSSCTTTRQSLLVVDGQSSDLLQEHEEAECDTIKDVQEEASKEVGMPVRSSAAVENVSDTESRNQEKNSDDGAEQKVPEVTAEAKEHDNSTVEVQQVYEKRKEDVEADEYSKDSISHKHEKSVASSEQQEDVSSSVQGIRSANPMKDKSFMWPVSGSVLKHIEQQNDDFRDGITIKAKSGTSVFSAADGVVILCKHGNEVYGNYVVVKHGKYTVTYGNLKSIEIKKGQQIKKGSIIGTVGRTGQAKQPQLFFSVKKKGIVINPE